MRLTHPTAPQLLRAVEDLLTELLPELDEAWGYRAWGARTAVAMVRRELDSEPVDPRTLRALVPGIDGDADELEDALAQRIDEGAFVGREDELAAYLLRAARDRLVVVNPAWLEPDEPALSKGQVQP